MNIGITCFKLPPVSPKSFWKLLQFVLVVMKQSSPPPSFTYPSPNVNVTRIEFVPALPSSPVQKHFYYRVFWSGKELRVCCHSTLCRFCFGPFFFPCVCVSCLNLFCARHFVAKPQIYASCLLVLSLSVVLTTSSGCMLQYCMQKQRCWCHMRR